MNSFEKPVLVAREDELPNRNWRVDPTRFARLLYEIAAIGLTPEQYQKLGESMDLDREAIDELLERAGAQWSRELSSQEQVSSVYLHDPDRGSRFDRRVDVVYADSSVHIRAPLTPEEVPGEGYEPMVAVEYYAGFVRALVYAPKREAGGVDMTCEEPEVTALQGPVTAAQQEAIWRQVEQHSADGKLTAPVFIWPSGTPLAEVRAWFESLHAYALEVFTPPAQG